MLKKNNFSIFGYGMKKKSNIIENLYIFKLFDLYIS